MEPPPLPARRLVAHGGGGGRREPADALSIPAAILIVAGVVVSRVWSWRTDPVEQRAAISAADAAATAWSRWSEIVAGGLFAIGLGALAFEEESVAVAAGIALAVWIGALFALDQPPA